MFPDTGMAVPHTGTPARIAPRIRVEAVPSSRGVVAKDGHQEVVSRLTFEHGIGAQPALLDEAHLAIGADGSCIVRQHPKSDATHIEVREGVVDENPNGI